MHLQMLLKIAFLQETLSADVAKVFSFPIMNAFVYRHVPFRLESFRTVLTSVSKDVRMDFFNVASEIHFMPEILMIEISIKKKFSNHTRTVFHIEHK